MEKKGISLFLKNIILSLLVMVIAVVLVLSGFAFGRAYVEEKVENPIINEVSYEPLNDCSTYEYNKTCDYFDNGNLKIKMIKKTKKIVHDSQEYDEDYYNMYINNNLVKKEFLDSGYPYIKEIIEDDYIVFNTGLTYILIDKDGNDLTTFNDNLNVYDIKYVNGEIVVDSKIEQEGFYHSSKEELCKIFKDYNIDYYEIKRVMTYDKETKEFRAPAIISSVSYNDYAKAEYNETCD